jgi:polyribonucleotide nucleotidyltransferase
MTTIKIDPEKIGALIGPGGKDGALAFRNGTGVKIDIRGGRHGLCRRDRMANHGRSCAVDEIRGSDRRGRESGASTPASVTRIEPYGVFVEFLPGREGMVHISQLAALPRARSIAGRSPHGRRADGHGHGRLGRWQGPA